MKKMKQILIIFLILISNCFPKLFRSNAKFDPDIDICDDPTLDGGIVADDGETYLFKGLYYWKTRPLNTDSGIMGFADLTTNKWPDIKSEIRVVFTVPKGRDLITIFVLKSHWYGYQKGEKTMEGPVDSWAPGLVSFKLNAAFTPVYGGTKVYVLHSDNTNYILYDFKNVSNPTKVRGGMASVRVNYLLFTEDIAKPIPSSDVIKGIIDVRAGLTYKDQMFLVSRDKYCVLALRDGSFDRECNTKPVNKIFGCPLDVSKRPQKPKISAETPGGKTDAPNIGLTSAIATNVTKSPQQSVSVVEPIPSNWQMNDNEANATVRLGIPILGRELEEDQDFVGNTTGPMSAAGAEAMAYEKNEQNSSFWFIAVGVVFLVIALCSILMVGIVSKVAKKRPKGEVLYI